MLLVYFSISKTHVVNEVKFLDRVFTLGIGSGASTALVKGMARAGRGSYEFTAEEDRLHPKVSVSWIQPY